MMRYLISLTAELRRLSVFHFKNGLLLSVRNILIALFSLIVTYTCANYLKPETFGSYKYLIGLVAFTSVFTLTGASPAVVQTIAKTGENPIRFIAKKSFQFSLGASLFLLIFAVYYVSQNNYTFAMVIALAAVLLPFEKSSSLFQTYYNATRRYQTLGSAQLISNFVISLSIILAILLSGNLLIISCVFFISTAVTKVITYTWSCRTFSFPQQSIDDTPTFNFAKKMSLLFLLRKVIDQADILLAYQFAGPVATAAFSIAKTPIQLLIGQANIVQILALPQFSRHTNLAVRSSIHHKAVILSLLMTVSGLLYVVTAPFLYKFLFPKYIDFVHYSQILAAALPAVSHILYSEALTASRDVLTLFILETIAPTLRIILVLYLAINFQLEGIVIGFVLGYWLRFLITLILYYGYAKH